MNYPGRSSQATSADAVPAPAPPLIAPTGNATVDAMASVVNQAASPFQNLSSQHGVLQKANAVVGGIMGLVQAPLNLLNTGFAQATNFISEALPAFPAATIGALHIGTPHIHEHPPSFIPPAPPVPLPSIGPVMLSGSVAVLIEGMPAARAGDIGISVTCGSLAPPFEVFTGSSKVFIGGGRAARLFMDITKHCQPGEPPVEGAAEAASTLQKIGQAAGAAMPFVGLAAGALNVAAQESAMAAGMAGAQLAADAAAMAMTMLMGTDPGEPPCYGMLVGAPGTVLVGGFPMPPWKTVAKGLKKLLSAISRGRRGGQSQGKFFCFRCM